MSRRPRLGRPPIVELIDADMAAVYAAKTGAERLAMAADSLRFAQQLIRSAVRRAHDDWGDEQIAREAARRLSGGFS
jgi:hypothetical protein